VSGELPIPEALALVAGALVVLAARKGLLDKGSLSRFVAASAVASAILSALYVGYYLRGGPRIVDATSYWLEARLFAAGSATLPLGGVPAAVAGRFLVRAATSEPSLAVIFPPGYPFVLSLAMRAHAPMLLGPILAALLTASTAWLTLIVARAAGLVEENADRATRVAALLVTVCATLRYHTADTMSHGLSAVCFTAALAASASTTRRASALSGASLALLFTTRPVTALAAAPFVIFFLLRAREDRAARAGLALASAIPFVVAFFVYQQHVTGTWTTSPQAAYYAASDGPHGCFAYGFGADVGCLLEHGDFVRHNLPHGYGPLQAIMTTLRRLKMHLGDPLNAWPSFVIALGALTWGLRTRALRPVALVPIVLAVAYAPFYFDGNYPGGGARFLSEALPAELALVAVGAVIFCDRRARPAWIAHVPVVIALCGFALLGATDHRQLRDREGGLPMFEMGPLPVTLPALVYVDTDHGFNLAYGGPFAVARLRNDANDFFAWEAAGRPPAYRYVFDVSGANAPVLVPHLPEEPRALQGESLWPPARQRAGYVVVRHDPAASNGKRLGYVADERGDVDVSVMLPAASLDYVWVAALTKTAGTTASVVVELDGREVFRATLLDVEEGALPPIDVVANRGPDTTLTLRVLASRAGLRGDWRDSPPILELDALALEPRATRFAARGASVDTP
jgi:hypothetical protein